MLTEFDITVSIQFTSGKSGNFTLKSRRNSMFKINATCVDFSPGCEVGVCVCVSMSI